MIKSIQISVFLLLGCMYHTLAQNSSTVLKLSSVSIEITGVSSDDGAVFIAMYTDDESWLNTTDFQSKSNIENGKATVKFDNVPVGQYAISVYHDENDNGEMDTNFMGIPKEDYACSNDAKGRFGPPKWEDAVFEVDGIDLTQVIKF